MLTLKQRGGATDEEVNGCIVAGNVVGERQCSIEIEVCIGDICFRIKIVFPCA